ncbi:topoisomerase I damage affected protein 7-like [Pistacia vera]|uniref:topoisomerase I damage affected protein 7-like n=1 Tax=Pistacia vera TaxID=55513 RepID=UPI001262BA40|nr:topoisomerase I damage affected protein 7-like [Pistacia vera]
MTVPVPAPVDPAWYMDSGDTDHVTPDPTQLISNRPYDGVEQLQVGNGESLHISHIGSTLFPNSFHSKCLHLRNVLCVPKITKNLLSISRFTKDNQVIVEFGSDCCVVKDKATKAVLLQGGLKAGLYQLRIPSCFSSGYTSGGLEKSATLSSRFCNTLSSNKSIGIDSQYSHRLPQSISSLNNFQDATTKCNILISSPMNVSGMFVFTAAISDIPANNNNISDLVDSYGRIFDNTSDFNNDSSLNKTDSDSVLHFNSVVDADANSTSMLKDNENSMLDVNANPASMLNDNENSDSVLHITSMVDADANSTSMLKDNENFMLDVNANPVSMLKDNENSATTKALLVHNATNATIRKSDTYHHHPITNHSIVFQASNTRNNALLSHKGYKCLEGKIVITPNVQFNEQEFPFAIGFNQQLSGSCSPLLKAAVPHSSSTCFPFVSIPFSNGTTSKVSSAVDCSVPNPSLTTNKSTPISSFQDINKSIHSPSIPKPSSRISTSTSKSPSNNPDTYTSSLPTPIPSSTPYTFPLEIDLSCYHLPNSTIQKPSISSDFTQSAQKHTDHSLVVDLTPS